MLGGPDNPQHRYAVVFYATDEMYAISALVFMHLLRKAGLREDADVVVLHRPLGPAVLGRMRESGFVTVATPEFPPAQGRYYRHSLLKLAVLGLTRYERVVYVDSDAVPLKSLDPLFTFPFDGPIAAPIAYWLPQPFWGSYLMVVKPSAGLRSRAEKHYTHAAIKPYYDMDIINAEFGGEICSLPIECVCLNSEWEDVEHPGFFGDPIQAYSKVSVVHFTALGKPWFYSQEAALRLRPKAHPIFHDLWRKWWQARDEVLDTRKDPRQR